jgi:hypothetical protein
LKDVNFSYIDDHRNQLKTNVLYFISTKHIIDNLYIK